MIRRKGISMIVLIITIMVMIILITTAVLTLKDQGAVEQARIVVLKDDILTMKTDLENYISDKQFEAISNGQFYNAETDAKLQKITDYNELKKIIKTMHEDYDGVFMISKGKLMYCGTEASDEQVAKVLSETDTEIYSDTNN